MLSTKEILAYLRDDRPADGKKPFTQAEARMIGEALGIQWGRFDVEQFRVGLNTELERSREDPGVNATSDEPMVTGKIVLARLTEFPDYYSSLAVKERESEQGRVAERKEGGTG